MDTKTARIRALNDELRQNFAGGIAVMTPGIAALGAEAVARIVKTIAVYDDFCHANDPHEEHDFGAFDADGHRVFFKIDYYDKTLTYHSPDPADPSVTERVNDHAGRRVLTIRARLISTATLVREGIVARRRRKPRPSATSREEPQPKLPPIELSMNEFYGPPR
jgi:hypothetical protein